MAAHSVIPSVSRLIGVDGEWSNQENNNGCYEFQSIHLDKEFYLGERFDLVISMEVGEHLPSRVAQRFVSSLVNHADLILFSAAIRGQGGINHINEQPQSYWVQLFSENQYKPYFFLRRQLWEDSSIGYWYRQNMCCFVKQDSFVDSELQPIEEKSRHNFLIDIAHPEALTSRSAGRVEQLGKSIDYRIWRAKSLARALAKKRKPGDSSSP